MVKGHTVAKKTEVTADDPSPHSKLPKSILKNAKSNDMSCNQQNQNNNSKLYQVFNEIPKSKESNCKLNNQKAKIEQKDLKILTSNIRGWRSKSESLSNVAKTKQPDIIILTETHCSGNVAPSVKGYTTYFENRKSKL